MWGGGRERVTSLVRWEVIMLGELGEHCGDMVGRKEVESIVTERDQVSVVVN